MTMMSNCLLYIFNPGMLCSARGTKVVTVDEYSEGRRKRRLGEDGPSADSRLQPARRLTLQRRQTMSGKERRLAVLHDARVGLHFGVDQTLAHLERHSYWPRIEAEASYFIPGLAFLFGAFGPHPSLITYVSVFFPVVMQHRGLSGAVSASKAASERSLKVVVVERATREESYRSKTVLDWTGPLGRRTGKSSMELELGWGINHRLRNYRDAFLQNPTRAASQAGELPSLISAIYASYRLSCWADIATMVKQIFVHRVGMKELTESSGLSPEDYERFKGPALLLGQTTGQG
ncbi:hypothetical protein V6N11_014180 [Hibiscus sabdariffa]|uniref:Uncharacterized protein n=1 Tax=Hibiscus sabdariffa TaxID=183260 RepID=A0ABR2AH80_9ROSI